MNKIRLFYRVWQILLWDVFGTKNIQSPTPSVITYDNKHFVNCTWKSTDSESSGKLSPLSIFFATSVCDFIQSGSTWMYSKKENLSIYHQLVYMIPLIIELSAETKFTKFNLMKENLPYKL